MRTLSIRSSSSTSCLSNSVLLLGSSAPSDIDILYPLNVSVYPPVIYDAVSVIIINERNKLLKFPPHPEVPDDVQSSALPGLPRGARTTRQRQDEHHDLPIAPQRWNHGQNQAAGLSGHEFGADDGVAETHLRQPRDRKQARPLQTIRVRLLIQHCIHYLHWIIFRIAICIVFD